MSTKLVAGSDSSLLLIKAAASADAKFSNTMKNNRSWWTQQIRTQPWTNEPKEIFLFSLKSNSTFGFSRNTKSWQCWHFCTTSNSNELETVKSPVIFKTNLHVSWCFENWSDWSNLINTIMPTLPTFYIIFRARLHCRNDILLTMPWLCVSVGLRDKKNIKEWQITLVSR